jgi:hypothetical protein
MSQSRTCRLEPMKRMNRRDFLKDSAILSAGAREIPGFGADRWEHAADFYVSTQGNDDWSGKLPSPNSEKTDGPFRTLEHSRNAIRQLKAENRFNKALTVMLRGGTYTREGPFVLRAEDSGTKRCPITYAAYPGERAVLSGGKTITGLKQGTGGLWIAEVPEVRAGKFYFRQLFVNGWRRTRARTPNKGYYSTPEPVVPEIRDAPENREAFRFKPGEINKNWKNLNDVEVVILQSWTEARLHIDGIDEATRTATFTGASWRPLTWSKGYYVENVYEALDQPGKWYLDRKTGLLRYWPMPGEDLTQVEVVAPAVRELVIFQGDEASERFVQYVTLRGLTFAFTAWTMPAIGYAYPQAELFASSYPGWLYTGGTEIPLPQSTSSERVPAAIRTEGALDCSFEGNELVHLGAWGIELTGGSRNIRVSGNSIQDVGAGGIKIGAAENPKKDVEVTSSILVSDNILSDGSQVYLGSPAIFVGESNRNRIAHNEIRGRWQWGISVGWNEDYVPPNRARDNIIESNHLHHMGEGPLGTHGAIYTAGISPGTVIKSNLIHHIAGGGTGIVLDNGSGGILLEGNVVYHTDGGGLNTNFNVVANVVRNNIFAFGKNQQLTRYGDPPHSLPPPPNTSIFYQNIVYWKEGNLYGDKKWLNFDMVQDYNLYCDASGRPVKFLGYDFEDWKKKSLYLDQHSVIADPLFADPENGNFKLKPESPAIQFGFEPIDLSHVGPRTQGFQGLLTNEHLREAGRFPD